MMEFTPALEDAAVTSSERRDIMRCYRKLLNRWVVAAGRDRTDLAEITVLVLNGEDYGDAIAKVS